MAEQTFFILKPDCLSRKLEKTVLDFLKYNNFKLLKSEKIHATKEQLRKHYSHIVNKPFYKDVEDYMMSGPILIGILEKDNAIDDLRKIMGNTNPLKAEKNTIRALYGEVDDSGNIFNVIHGSDSKEAKERELDIWFK